MSFQHTMNRRSALKLLGALGLGTAAPEFVFNVQAFAAQSSLHTVSKTLPLMKTLVSMTVCDRSRTLAEEALGQAFEHVQALIPVFNRFDAGSHLSRLNRSGILREVPAELFQVLETSKYLFYQSRRSFDVTILPLLEAHQQSVLRTGRPPEHPALQSILQTVGFEKLELHPGTVRFTRPGMRITLDGIAKGYLVDRAAEALRRQGVHSALINAGGDIRAIGDKGGAPWRIGLQDPLDRKRTAATFKLTDTAVATSGNYQNAYDPLARHHHIVSKGLGDAPQGILSVTVLAPSAMLADGLSTMLFLNSPEENLRQVASLPECEALIMTRGGRTHHSSGLQRFLS